MILKLNLQSGGRTCGQETETQIEGTTSTLWVADISIEMVIYLPQKCNCETIQSKWDKQSDPEFTHHRSSSSRNGAT